MVFSDLVADEHYDFLHRRVRSHSLRPNSSGADLLHRIVAAAYPAAAKRSLPAGCG